MGESITAPEVRLINSDGGPLGVVSRSVALRLAGEVGLDLVEVSPFSKPPVVKIMDYGKFRYEASQKAKEARRRQSGVSVKEVRFRLKICDNDYDVKLRKAISFLQAGDKVKVMILFRGREQSRPELGVKLLKKFADDISEFGSADSLSRTDGRGMAIMVSPIKSKTIVREKSSHAQKGDKQP
ncbi:translation initiation factor IF-3 [Tropheryma whipplei]|uniref:Translation initiation factor IF-3 n=2 Tax=Tropheryma whipplei TaxID=2039 RepID=IF3_TROWT|nr:translation initiation factor IF-3 [Tropheryma whipplei]Q83GT2.1 RecName: Full=Translation initiation factor IF-3 [Tropheryma whipplei str. Twist]Q83HH0.1 RecName: Full=Translation initiation factor IF-3 [Tropheryma whipplei TW08/27]AAO44261.1 translation initiation factor IF-3 [Tropheryma whipplei str. Twist]MCO8182928.1 translation initiation factor IF-3 [Tropheryma whipplei]MCO8190517.1 translation initiation factor IF-3 [Tropheryma whipplei]CAD67273.1 translation initiation factor IF-3